MPAPVEYEVSCPTPSQGWVVSWRWPGDPPPGVAGYRIRTQRLGGPILTHSLRTWSGPGSEPVDIRVPTDWVLDILTDYVDADRATIGSVTERFVPPTGDC